MESPIIGLGEAAKVNADAGFDVSLNFASVQVLFATQAAKCPCQPGSI